MSGTRKHDPIQPDETSSGLHAPESAQGGSPLRDDYFEDVASSLEYGRDGQPPVVGQGSAVTPLQQPDQPSFSPYPPLQSDPSHFDQQQRPQDMPYPGPAYSHSPAMAVQQPVPPASVSGVQPPAYPAHVPLPNGPPGYWPDYHYQGDPAGGSAPHLMPTGQMAYPLPPGAYGAAGPHGGVEQLPPQGPIPEIYRNQVVSAVPGRYDMYDQQMQSSGDIVVPRVSIQCFFERPFVQSTLVSVMRDRRMTNVSMEIEVGGLAAAIRHYGSNETPHLIVVESTAVGEQLLAHLDALANHCDETVKVIVIGAANDVQLYRELKKRGVSEYLVPPIHPVQLIQVISGLFLDDDDPFIGRTIAVCGARGGCGASTIAHNLAWSFAERIGTATTLVDLDLNFGTVGLDFNQESVQSIADVLAAPDELDISILDRMVAKISRNLSLLNAPVSLDTPYEFDSETYVQVIDQVRRSVPLVVLDLPHVWTDWFDKVTTAADDIVVVASPDLTSLRNVQKLFKVFTEKRMNDAPPKLLLNMTGVAKRPEIPATEFTKVADVRPEASIGFDARLFGKAANNGQMLAMVDPNAVCVSALDDLATALVGRKAEIKPKSSAIVDTVRQLLPGS